MQTYRENVTTKKRGDHWWIKYSSPLTGKMVRIPLKVTGPLSTREAADLWVAHNLDTYLQKELKRLELQQWRKAVTVVRLYNIYEPHRKLEIPKSAQQDLSMLRVFVLPYFVTTLQLSDPNKWWEYEMPFRSWLTSEAKTREEKSITVSTANKAINAFNHFLKWMRDYKHIERSNYQPFENIDAGLQNKRGADVLVDADEFSLVYGQLKKKSDLFSDMWLVQYHTAMRVGEVLGLAFNWLTTAVPEQVSKPFVAAGFTVYGAILLESQPKYPYIKRVNGEIPRKALKWRKEISTKNSRVVPIVDKDAWNILARRFKTQKALFEKLEYGPKRDSYLLFDRAQRNDYLDAIREAYEKVGLKSKQSHGLRHTRITAWETIGLEEKVSELILGNKSQARQDYLHIVELLNNRAREIREFDTIEEAV